jgi:hypothetical protein
MISHTGTTGSFTLESGALLAGWVVGEFISRERWWRPPAAA